MLRPGEIARQIAGSAKVVLERLEGEDRGIAFDSRTDLACVELPIDRVLQVRCQHSQDYAAIGGQRASVGQYAGRCGSRRNEGELRHGRKQVSCYVGRLPGGQCRSLGSLRSDVYVQGHHGVVGVHASQMKHVSALRRRKLEPSGDPCDHGLVNEETAANLSLAADHRRFAVEVPAWGFGIGSLGNCLFGRLNFLKLPLETGKVRLPSRDLRRGKLLPKGKQAEDGHPRSPLPPKGDSLLVKESMSPWKESSSLLGAKVTLIASPETGSDHSSREKNRPRRKGNRGVGHPAALGHQNVSQDRFVEVVLAKDKRCGIRGGSLRRSCGEGKGAELFPDGSASDVVDPRSGFYGDGLDGAVYFYCRHGVLLGVH